MVGGMKLSLYPSSAQLQALVADGADTPVVMLNLLRFKPGGEPAYRRYAEAMRAIIARHGGRVVWTGRITAQVIGAGAEGLEVAALVEYPSRKAFVAIATSPEVAAITGDRAEGLEGQWLLATTTEP